MHGQQNIKKKKKSLGLLKPCFGDDRFISFTKFDEYSSSLISPPPSPCGPTVFPTTVCITKTNQLMLCREIIAWL